MKIWLSGVNRDILNSYRYLLIVKTTERNTKVNTILKNKNTLIYAIIIFISMATIINQDFSFNAFQNFQTSSWLSAVLILLLYAIKSITMTMPNSVLYIATGILFPPVIAILITYLGLTVSLTVGYVSGNLLGEKKVYNLIEKNKKIKKFFGIYKNNLLLLCLMTRLLSFPFGIVSFFLGALKMPFTKYIITSLLGVSPIMIPIVIAGDAITNPLSLRFMIPIVIAIAFILIMFFTIRKKKNLTIAG